MFNIVLVHPDIPHNTGAIGRLCLSTRAKLHLVRPLGFDLDEKAVKRAGLDYWQEVNVMVWESLEEFKEACLNSNVARFYLFTTKAEKPYWDHEFREDDYLIFGAETRGLPEDFLEDHPERCLTIPIDQSHVRSLNLATAAGIVLFEGVRQLKVS